MIWTKYLICLGAGLTVRIHLPDVFTNNGQGAGIESHVFHMGAKSLSLMRADGYACVLGYNGKISGTCGLVADPKQDAVACEAK